MNSTIERAMGVAAALFLLLPSVADAQWDYGIDLDLGVIQTDNVFLADDGEEQSETVFTVAPDFYLRTDSDRIQANLQYRPEAYFYSDLDNANEVFHVVDAVLTGALIRDRLFLYLSGANSQSIVTPEGQIPTSNLPISGNRIDTTTFEVRPYWQQRLGPADLFLQAGLVDRDYDQENFQSSQQYHGQFRLDNVQRQDGISWGVEYRYIRTEYEMSIPFEFQQASASLGYWFNGTFRVFGTGGVETAFDNFGDSNLDEDFYEGGFQYVPNSRMNLEVAMGQRSYGDSYRGDFSYELRRGNLMISYDEGPATRAELAFNYRPISDDEDLDNIFDRPGDSDRFIRKRWNLNLRVDLSKSDLTLRMFTEDRKQRLADDQMMLEDQQYSGAGLQWNWNFGTKTSMNVSYDYSERDEESFGDSLRRAQIGVTYEIGQRSSIRLSAVNSRQEGDRNTDFDYTENQLRLLFRVKI